MTKSGKSADLATGERSCPIPFTGVESVFHTGNKAARMRNRDLQCGVRLCSITARKVLNYDLNVQNMTFGDEGKLQ